MTKNFSRQDNSSENPKIGKTIINDFREGDIPRNLIQEFKDLYQFYIDYESKKKLAQMGHVRRRMRVGWWILKSMFFKLTPVRRILLLIGIIAIISFADNPSKEFIFGLLIIIIVIMLELKDKLLARDELKIGRAVQMSLMPDRMPEIPGWDCWLFTRPANDVGGDLIDFLKLNEKDWCISLGDVAGKGLGAALLTAKLQATIRAIAPASKALSKLGEALNTIFLRDGLPDRFVTLIYLNLKIDSSSIKFLNAGHMPPILVSKGKVKELEKGDTALGVSPKAQFFEQKINLDKNDLLVIYSDGVTDSRNTSNIFFGEQRFFNLLSTIKSETAEQVGKRIVRALDNFVSGAHQHDDVSIVILKRQA